MSRLVIVSNRVSTGQADGSQGGLAVALASALRESGGIWFGWSGLQTDRFSGHIQFQQEDGFVSATIDLEEQDIEEYYDGYANRTLWPLFHYRVDLAEYQRDFAEGYRRANERFAETLTPLIQPDDAIWVHDYHLLPLAAALRARGFSNRIGLFLHTPWPPRRLLATLPRARALVASLFDYDLLGFQADEWLSAFCDFAEQELGAAIEGDRLRTVDGRCVRLLVCPIGIDAAEFVRMSASPAAEDALERMKRSAAGRAIAVGVDRLDYSKGIEERFLGYERFLDRHVEQRGRLQLVQVAPPSRASVATYRRIRADLERLAGRINGAHADLDWVPIHYVNQGYARDALAGVFRAARIGMVTPLRDGMNLVAKEYVAAQDPGDPGVLVLSRFAGAAEQLTDALLVNPYSVDELSDAIRCALAMPRGERIERWRRMMELIQRRDARWWREHYVQALLDAPARALAAPQPLDAIAIGPGGP